MEIKPEPEPEVFLTWREFDEMVNEIPMGKEALGNFISDNLTTQAVEILSRNGEPVSMGNLQYLIGMEIYRRVYISPPAERVVVEIPASPGCSKCRFSINGCSKCVRNFKSQAKNRKRARQ